MTLIALDLPPGVYRTGTRYQSQGRFYEADLWRWFEGTQRPVGGWRLKSGDSIDGKGRAIQTWADNGNATWIMVASNEGLFVFTRSGDLHEITPDDWMPGPADSEIGGGYGTGTYGTGVYGTPRPDSTDVIPAMVWTLDTWGEVPIACDGETIYEWDLDTEAAATPLAEGTSPSTDGAPPASAVFVTEEGAIVALGAAGDPRKLEWCDPENRHLWVPASTNLAGGFRLQSQGALVCGKRIRGGAVVFTDVDCHLMTYAPGSPDVYDIQRLASGCGIVSKQAAAVVDSRAWWFGANRFWEFNGAVSPLECDVGDYVFGDINRGQLAKVTAVHNSQFGEVWWFYPSASSIENDRYVSYNYREGHWNIGRLVRLCGTDKGVIPYPLMVDANGCLYEHEVGQARDGRRPYAISGPVEIGTGDNRASIYDVIPDEANLGDVDVRFANRDWTMSPESVVGPVSLTARTNVRFNTRQVAVEMIADPDKDFRVGRFRFNVKSSSRR